MMTMTKGKKDLTLEQNAIPNICLKGAKLVILTCNLKLEQNIQPGIEISYYNIVNKMTKGVLIANKRGIQIIIGKYMCYKKKHTDELRELSLNIRTIPESHQRHVFHCDPKHQSSPDILMQQSYCTYSKEHQLIGLTPLSTVLSY